MPELGTGTLGALTGAGGGLLYSLIAGKKGDGFGDHLRRAAIGAGIGGAAGLGYGALTGPREYEMYNPPDDPEERAAKKMIGSTAGNALASGLMTRAYGGGTSSMGLNAAIGALTAGAPLSRGQRVGVAAGHGALMGLLSPRGIRGAASRGGNFKKRLGNMGAAAIYNMLASQAGTGIGDVVGSRI